MCPYITGDGSGAVVSEGDVASGIMQTAMFVAINGSSVASNINLNINNVSDWSSLLRWQFYLRVVPFTKFIFRLTESKSGLSIATATRLRCEIIASQAHRMRSVVADPFSYCDSAAMALRFNDIRPSQRYCRAIAASHAHRTSNWERICAYDATNSHRTCIAVVLQSRLTGRLEPHFCKSSLHAESKIQLRVD